MEAHSLVINSVLDMSFTNVFSRSVVCLFVLSCMDVRGEITLDCEEIQPVNPRGNQS